jgi:ribonuclease J
MSKSKYNPDELLFLPLGGTGEIGMNLNIYGYKGKWLIVDLGVSFGDDTMPMIEVVMPDPAWIEARKDDLVGIVITHGHEDHLGAVQYLWRRLRCPVYATPFAAAILHNKLHEAALVHSVPVNVVDLGSRFTVGPFDLEMVSLTHSIPEPNAIAIHTPLGTVLHTGDWKFDPDPLIGEPADYEKLRRLGKDGVLALIGDSTNVFSKGEVGSEATVRANLIELIGRWSGKVAVSCFATNVARLESITLAAHAHGRDVALVGRSLWRIDKAARDLGYLSHLPPYLTDHDAGYLPDDKVLYICTGSQGEPRAALARIANDDHPHVTLGEGDVVIFSSRIIPGNEKSIYRIQNELVRLGIEVVTGRDEEIHVSGHPGREEMKEMYRLVRPKLAVPVHGEARHIQEHARLALDSGAEDAIEIENGEMVRLAPGEPEIIDVIPVGRLGVDGVGDEGPRLVRLDGEILRSRRRMVYNGSAVVTLVLDRGGRLVVDPQLTALGLLDADHEAEEHDTVVDAVRDAVEEMSAKGRQDDGAVRETARRAVRRTLKEMLGHKPVTDVHLVRV